MSASTGTDSARVRCLYCGANNFPASPSCWQCGRPLRTLPADAPSSGLGPEMAASPAPTSTRAALTAPPVNTVLANKSAAALGLLFPPVALPVGMVFLMLDDPRKTHLGWITIGWSVVGTVLNVVFFLATMAPLMAFLKAFIPGSGHGGLPALPSIPGGNTENLITLLHSSMFLLRLGWQESLNACPIPV